MCFCNFTFGLTTYIYAMFPVLLKYVSLTKPENEATVRCAIPLSQSRCFQGCQEHVRGMSEVALQSHFQVLHVQGEGME